MAQTPESTLIRETAWQKALAREAVIRPIAFVGALNAAERFSACRQLDLRPTRFYQLLDQFRRKPITSSLLDEPPGPKKGRRRLSQEQEAAVAYAILEIYCRRERPTVTAVHDHVRLICRQRNLPAPSWKAVKVRIDQADRQKLTKPERARRPHVSASLPSSVNIRQSMRWRSCRSIIPWSISLSSMR